VRLGLRKTPFGLSALCGVLLRHIFAVAGIASQFLYRNSKNVFYLNSLNEKRKSYKMFILPHVYLSHRAILGAGSLLNKCFF